jgi:hypothetical protein
VHALALLQHGVSNLHRAHQRLGAADRAIVVTVTVALAAVVPLTVNELEEKLQVDCGAGSAQLSDAVPLKSLVVPATLTV